jgi:hypothetical protein
MEEGEGGLTLARQGPGGPVQADRNEWEGAMFVIFVRQKPSPPSQKIVIMPVSRRSVLPLACLLAFLPVRADTGAPAREYPAREAEAARPDAEVEAPAGYYLYPDLTAEQSDLAHQALAQAYSANIKRARKSIAALRALEGARHLPPLSQLLSLAIDVMRYQNGDFQDEDEEKELLASISDAAEQGSYVCQQALKKAPGHPTYLLILGGIRGFTATLQIHGNPSQAMSDGFQALKLLEKARSADPRLKDCYLGTGIFNCTAANAPLFVRATLKIIGRSVTMKAGLEALRVSAYQGQYTPVSSQLFLIQFLSPYDQELAREKSAIFRSLEETFPRNPYYTFMKADEAICFHPDGFFTAASRTSLAARIASFAAADFASRRYGNLVRWQYTLLDPSPERRYAPDTSFGFRDYEYYPAFIEAVRYKRATEDTLEPGEKPPKAAVAALSGMRDSCLAMISDSPMNPTRKRYYQWHVTDALRWSPRPGRALPGGASTTSR